jgi:DivIVA domain-containing protein
MPLTPEDVANKQFTATRLGRGYGEEEVDDFLDEVEATLVELYRQLDDQRYRLDTLQRELDQARSQGTGPVPVVQQRMPDPVHMTAPQPQMRPQQQVAAEDPGERATGILAMAQRTADQFVTEARAESDRLLAQARSRAAEIARDAEEKRRQLVGSLDTERSDLQRRIEELRVFEREYRSRLRAYLENQLRELSSSDMSKSSGGTSSNGSNGSGGNGPAFASFSSTGGGRRELPMND